MTDRSIIVFFCGPDTTNVVGLQALVALVEAMSEHGLEDDLRMHLSPMLHAVMQSLLR